jgi:hypothetical protein
VIFQFLNEIHLKEFKKVPVKFAAKQLLEKKGMDPITNEPSELLYTFREMQRVMII